MTAGWVMCFICSGVYLERGDSFGFICFLIAGILLSTKFTTSTSKDSKP